MEERLALVGRAIDALVRDGEALAAEITWQMGRPIARARARSAGWRSVPAGCWPRRPRRWPIGRSGRKPGFTRFIRHEPLGLVFVVAPWNYPYLTAVNSIVPALAAGNVVLLKHSAQTPLCAERFQQAFDMAGLPPGVFQHLHLESRRGAADRGQRCGRAGGVHGLGAGGHAVQAAAAETFIATNLELGGKDPAYVREDADLGQAVESLVDGACFNSGQSCCGIERIYVHRARFDEFVAWLCRAGRADTSLAIRPTRRPRLGPMVRAAAADFARGQVDEAVAQGARSLIDPAGSRARQRGSAYMAPQCLVGVSHAMRIMQRGELRADRRHHAGRRRRRGDPADERQRVRPHRLGLDRR